MRQKQLELISQKKYRARKVLRVVGIGEPNHVVFKARLPILRLHHLLVRQVIREAQTRYGIRIQALAIMENHLHFVILVPSRTAFSDAMRFLAGQIALRVGRGKLWLERAWSRLVRWGRDYRGVLKHVQSNPIRAGVFDEVDVFVFRKGFLESG